MKIMRGVLSAKDSWKNMKNEKAALRGGFFVVGREKAVGLPGKTLEKMWKRNLRRLVPVRVCARNGKKNFFGAWVRN